MGKTAKGKAKTAAKIAKATRKIARKCKGKCALLAFGLALLCGCATSDSQQPAKANTMSTGREKSGCLRLWHSTAHIRLRSLMQ